jgi:uncharacterized protein
MSRSFSPAHLDVAAFAEAKGHLEGRDSLSKFKRLTEETRRQEGDFIVHWQADGERRRAVDGSQRPAVHLRAEAELPLTCQRCMGPMTAPLRVDRHFVFVPDEDTAAALDDESEDDVLALTADFDLPALIEDELLMTLPLVPRHEDCPVPVRLSAEDADFDAGEVQEHPFAALAALKKGSGPH